MKRNTFSIFVITMAAFFLIAGAAVAGPGCGSKAAKTASSCGDKAETASLAKATDGDKTVVLNVSNMTCNGCVSHISKTLAKVDGVNDVKVSLEDNTATVAYNAEKIDASALSAVVVKAGYPATVAGADGKVCADKASASGCTAAQKAACAATCTAAEKAACAGKTDGAKAEARLIKADDN